MCVCVCVCVHVCVCARVCVSVHMCALFHSPHRAGMNADLPVKVSCEEIHNLNRANGITCREGGRKQKSPFYHYVIRQ